MNATATTSISLQRVQSWSQKLRWLCWIFMGLIGLAMMSLISWQLMRVIREGIPLYQVLTGSLFLHIAWIIGLWLVARVLHGFERGEVLVNSTARSIKRLGLWVAATSALVFAPSFIAQLFAESPLPERLWSAVDSFLSVPGITIVVGLFVLMLGWVLQEAAQLQENEDLTI